MTELDRIRDIINKATTQKQIAIAEGELSNYNKKKEEQVRLQSLKDKLLKQIEDLEVKEVQEEVLKIQAAEQKKK